MNQSFEITVIYAIHESDGPVPAFPKQTLPSDQIQVIPVSEKDPWHPRKEALAHLSEAEGAYTIVLDAGDGFSDSFLEQMLTTIKKSGSALVMPYLMEGFSGKSKKPKKQKEKQKTRRLDKQPLFGKTLTLDARENPIQFPVELYGLLIPTGALKRAAGTVSGKTEPEKQILLYLLDENPVFIYQAECLLKYILPQERNHEYDLRPLTREWYYEPFEKFLLPALAQEKARHGTVPHLLQRLALYMINIRFDANKDNRNKYVLTPEEVPAYMDLFSDVLSYVSTENILNVDVYRSSSGIQFNLTRLRLKHRDWQWFPEITCTDENLLLTSEGVEFAELDELSLNINLIDYIGGRLEIDGSFPNYFSNEQAELYARFGREVYRPVYNQRFSLVKYFGVSFYKMKTFHLSVPVPDPSVLKQSASGEFLLNFYLKPKGQKEYRLNYGFPSHTSRFARCFTAGYWRFGDYLSYYDEEGIHVRATNPLRVFAKEIRLWGQMAARPRLRKYLLLKIPNFLLRPWFSHQHIWLFMDKIYKGGDSSEYLYKYAAEQKDGIRKYYLLDGSSADYARLKKEGYRPLRRGGPRHRLIFMNADMVIASNSTVFAFNSYSTNTSQAIRGDVHFDVACVQHGMSVQKIAKAQHRLRDNTRLYFCASKYEIENLSKPVYDYQGYDALKLTGVPRYDGLKSRAQKILLFSPTWRMNSVLPATRGESVARSYNPHFKETDYYRIYNSIINDPRLLAAAKKYGYRIQYVLHPLISPQVNDFEKNDLVEIIPSIGDMSYEKLFCEAALMVTDFSGVQFDFAYMRKPVVYLHHEEIPEHYEEGTFFYDTMGFGEICRTNDELIDVLCRYMENDCRMPDKYRQRADDFFAYSDNSNCERIYPIMLEHEKTRHASRY